MKTIDNIKDSWNRNKERAKVIAGAVATVFLVNYGIGNLTSGSDSNLASDCEVYRGYRAIKEEDMIVGYNYSFDTLKNTERQNGAEYILSGPAELKDILQKDKRYCFSYEKDSNTLDGIPQEDLK
ncbi:MAG: hypothetical protein WD876_00110 [Candidatus Pacearchaeota archaeon]